MYCSNCGYKFQNYDDKECRLCGSRKKTFRAPKSEGYSYRSSGSGKKKYIIIPVIIVGIFFAINMTQDQEMSLPEVSLPNISDIVQDDGIYQISISEIPSFADKGTIETGVSKAMMMWENSNPELEFELTDERGEIQIEWREFISSDVLGTEAVGYQEGRKLVIELGSYDCRGTWQQYSSNMIADTIAHETGHYLGLKHHTNESHLMYGDDELTQIEFNDLGYNIPSPYLEYTEWIAYEKLESRYNQLQKQYDQFPQTISDPVQYNRAVQIYNELNQITDEMICIANM